MKKIYFIDDSIDKIGGVERVINVLSNELSKNYEVIIISKTKNRTETFYKYNDKVKIKYLWDNTKLLSNNINNKFIYYLLRIIEKLNYKFTIKRKLKEVTKTIKNDDIIIFGRVHSAINYIPYFYNYHLNPKIIVRDAINLDYFSDKMKEKIKKYFPKFVKCFIVSSEESLLEYKSFFKNNYVNMKKIYNPLGIEVPNLNYDFSQKKVISIGRMEDDQKGFSALIQAFNIVHKSANDWKLFIYGEGKIRKKYQDLIDNLNANDYIKIANATKNVVEVFKKCSFFVSTSRCEGYANILVEALSCGIPCISYNWKTGVEEIIKDNKNGKIVNLIDRNKYYNGYDNTEDYNNLAKEMIYLINNKKICENFSKNAKNIIKTRKIDKIISKWLEIIKEVM